MHQPGQVPDTSLLAGPDGVLERVEHQRGARMVVAARQPRMRRE